MAFYVNAHQGLHITKEEPKNERRISGTRSGGPR